MSANHLNGHTGGSGADNTRPAHEEGDAYYDVSNNDGDGSSSMREEHVSARSVAQPAICVGGAGAKVIHPDAVKLFTVCPALRFIPIFREACEGFGPKCVLALGFCYFFAKGFANNIIGYARYAMFRNRFGIDGTRYQRLASISKLGWSIKAFTAMLTDTFATFGYTKRWYMAASCVLGAAFGAAFGALPAKPSSADVGAGFLFLFSYSIANIDILSEGHYSRLMRRVPEAGPNLVSWIWWCINVAGIVAAAVQGPLSDANLMHVGIFLAAGSQLICVVMFIFNWYGERTNREERADDLRVLHEELLKLRERAAAQVVDDDQLVQEEKEKQLGLDDAAPATVAVDEHADHLNDDLMQQQQQQDNRPPQHHSHDLVFGEDVSTEEESGEAFAEPDVRPLLCGAIEFNADMTLRNWRVLAYSVLMTCAVVTMTCVTILGDAWALLYACVVVSVICCAASFWALPLVISKANVFGYLQMVFYLSYPGALDSFYMATPECIADGPHFSYTFYNTVGAIIGNVGSILGVAAFSYIFSKHTYRLTFIISTLVLILASVFDIVMVKRWNMAIGIPDHAMYILGDSIVYEVCYMLTWMPMVLLLSRICPRGSESMVYALTAGFSNLGGSMANSLGSLLMELVWTVDTTEGSCNFDNVPMLLVVGHILCPLVIIPLTFLLIPAARVCDDIDVDGHAVKKEAKRLAAVRAAAAAEAENTSTHDSSEPFAQEKAEVNGKVEPHTSSEKHSRTHA